MASIGGLQSIIRSTLQPLDQTTCLEVGSLANFCVPINHQIQNHKNRPSHCVEQVPIIALVINTSYLISYQNINDSKSNVFITCAKLELSRYDDLVCFSESVFGG